MKCNRGEPAHEGWHQRAPALPHGHRHARSDPDEDSQGPLDGDGAVGARSARCIRRHDRRRIVQPDERHHDDVVEERDPDCRAHAPALDPGCRHQGGGAGHTLEGSGPFTVFAPTNSAFAALPKGTLKSLLKPANKAELASILTYHVVPGALKSSQIQPGAVKTVNGATFTVGAADGKLTITDGKGTMVHVIKANIAASNGVIHVISGVLLPPATS